MRIIYAMKAVILEGVFPAMPEEKAGIRRLCRFFLMLYAVPWFTADDAAEAALQDLKLLKRLYCYKKYDFLYLQSCICFQIFSLMLLMQTSDL